jgi:RNA polymerase sigma-70 factor (ECF subfamily)
MKQYQYKFTDEVITVEISDEWASVLAELDREQYNNDHAETRRHVSLDNGEDGEWLSTEKGKTLIEIAGKIFSPDDKRFRKGRKALSKKQAELYESVYDRGDSVGEYATDNKIDQSTASKRNSAVIKKFKKIFG